MGYRLRRLLNRARINGTFEYFGCVEFIRGGGGITLIASMAYSTTGRCELHIQCIYRRHNHLGKDDLLERRCLHLCLAITSVPLPLIPRGLCSPYSERVRNIVIVYTVKKHPCMKNA